MYCEYRCLARLNATTRQELGLILANRPLFSHPPPLRPYRWLGRTFSSAALTACRAQFAPTEQKIRPQTSSLATSPPDLRHLAYYKIKPLSSPNRLEKCPAFLLVFQATEDKNLVQPKFQTTKGLLRAKPRACCKALGYRLCGRKPESHRTLTTIPFHHTQHQTLQHNQFSWASQTENARVAYNKTHTEKTVSSFPDRKHILCPPPPR